MAPKKFNPAGPFYTQEDVVLITIPFACMVIAYFWTWLMMIILFIVGCWVTAIITAESMDVRKHQYSAYLGEIEHDKEILRMTITKIQTERSKS